MGTGPRHLTTTMTDLGQRKGDAPGAGDFVDVISLEQVPPGSLVRLPLAGTEVVVANADGSVSAFHDLCLRCGGTLTSGSLWGTRLICRGCGWQYDVGCGSVVGLPGLRLEKLPVRVEDGRIAIDCRTLPH